MSEPQTVRAQDGREDFIKLIGRHHIVDQPDALGRGRGPRKHCDRGPGGQTCSNRVPLLSATPPPASKPTSSRAAPLSMAATPTSMLSTSSRLWNWITK